MTDPIADMLTRIRNAIAVRKKDLELPHSNLKFQIADLLRREGFLGAVEKTGTPPKLHINLKYSDKEPAIRSIKRISKPGKRVYAASTELPRVLSDMGIAVISTSAGILTNKEARKRKLGGEVICEVY